MKKTLLFMGALMVMLAGNYSALAISTTTSSASTATSESTDAPAVTKAVPAVDAISSAMSEFKTLTRKERKERLKEVKKEIKQYKAEKKSGAEPSTNTLLLVILALLLPPLAVYLHEGEINNRFWISLILTLLGFLPGVIYSLIVILGDSA